MMKSTVQVIVSALLILVGVPLLLAWGAPVGYLAALILLSFGALTYTGWAAWFRNAHSDESDFDNEIGHANLPPTF